MKRNIEVFEFMRACVQVFEREQFGSASLSHSHQYDDDRLYGTLMKSKLIRTEVSLSLALALALPIVFACELIKIFIMNPQVFQHFR